MYYCIYQLIKGLTMYYEQAYIRRYKKETTYKNKNNEPVKRTIETVEARGIKKTSKFKDKQEIILISKNDFQEMQSQIKQLQETNNKLLNTINNADFSQTPNNNKMELKLIELMEIVNNRNELLLNTNEQFNKVIDAIINELKQEFNRIITDANNKNIKQMEIILNNILDNAQTEQNKLINNTINGINNELEQVSNELKQMSFIKLYRQRKKINISIDLDNLKQLPDVNNFNVGSINENNFFVSPNFDDINISRIKDNAKNNIDFNELYIKFADANNVIDIK